MVGSDGFQGGRQERTPRQILSRSRACDFLGLRRRLETPNAFQINPPMIIALSLLLSALHSPLSALSLFAVHLPDGNVVTPAWLIGGYLVAGMLVVMGSWRIE